MLEWRLNAFIAMGEPGEGGHGAKVGERAVFRRLTTRASVLLGAKAEESS